MRRKKPTAEQERLLTNALDAIRQSPETYDQLTYGLGSISCNTPGCVAGHIIADNAELRNELKRKLDGEDLTVDAEYKIGTAIHEIATKALGGLLFALEQLSGMGADLFLCDPHRIIVTGPRPLQGRNLDTRDLRSGMALIAAALASRGESRVGPLETVERGYADLVTRLRRLGAQVEVEPDL